MGLRFTVSRAHGVTPYRVIFGCEPLLPSAVKVREYDLEAALKAADAASADEYVESLAMYLSELRALVRGRLALYDSRSKKYFDQVHAEMESYEFKKGDPVILKQRKTGGIRLPAQGPYRFIRYLSSAKLTATI